MIDIVKSCPVNQTEVFAASARLGCGGDRFGNDEYLCLPNIETTRLVEYCHKGGIPLIVNGYCVATKGNQLYHKKCQQFINGCPSKPYLANEMYKYPACLNINTESRCYFADPSCPNTISTFTTEETPSIYSNFSNTTVHNSTVSVTNMPSMEAVVGSFLAAACVITVLLILLYAVLRKYAVLRRRKEKSREKATECNKCEDKVNGTTTYLEENEWDQQRIEKDEGTSRESKESSPLLPRNENENQSEEEGSCSELQELLEYTCTGPAKKILFNVVKMYVDDPDSYFNDELKKASVKSVLPPEYHPALNHDSESRNSIPVCRAILQLSLSAERQPKSGWDKEVKDTDTGVGDDVERVYQIHTLCREIENPEKISVDRYVRLFEMLIGAVERLDIKGKCSEDYREIVRRWEDIQRKLCMKDKWTTFTNFIRKWSQTE